MKPNTAYSILREIGNEVLSRYIYENIAEPIFDSHRITNPFPQDFKGHYERMLTAHSTEGSVEARNIVIANLIGIYLGRNKKALNIRKRNYILFAPNVRICVGLSKLA